MSYWFPLLVLMALLAAIAHGRISVSNQNAEFRVTASLATGEDIQAAYSKQNLHNLDDSSSLSALPILVQDWSLVCKQLCGADLGGVPCASYCKGVVHSKAMLNKNANNLLSSSNAVICKELCSHQLGGIKCDCFASRSTNKVQNGVCRLFCKHSNIKLDGCNPCTDNAALQADIDKVKVENGDTEIIGFDAVQTTTPDWNQLCESLCKTGDGGSLCNCDLSPFFFK